MLPGENDGKVTVASAGAGGPSKVLLLPTGHTWMMRNPVVISNTIAFLQNGTAEGQHPAKCQRRTKVLVGEVASRP